MLPPPPPPPPPPPENHAVYENSIAEWGQATDDNMAHPHCVLDT
jgi:hypothetical protein